MYFKFYFIFPQINSFHWTLFNRLKVWNTFSALSPFNHLIREHRFFIHPSQLENCSLVVSSSLIFTPSEISANTKILKMNAFVSQKKNKRRWGKGVRKGAGWGERTFPLTLMMTAGTKMTGCQKRWIFFAQIHPRNPETWNGINFTKEYSTSHSRASFLLKST